MLAKCFLGDLATAADEDLGFDRIGEPDEAFFKASLGTVLPVQTCLFVADAAT